MKSNSIVYITLINIIFFMNFSPLQAMDENPENTHFGPCTIDMEEHWMTNCSNCCSRCINNYECTKFCTFCCEELHKEITKTYNENNCIDFSAIVCLLCICGPCATWAACCSFLDKYESLNQPENNKLSIKRARAHS